MRRDHGLVPATADELARSALLLVAALAAVTGTTRWRRWAAVTAALQALSVAAAWAVDAGPVGLAWSVAWRGVAAGGLAGALAATTDLVWLGRGRRTALALATLAAGITSLGGLRGAAQPGALGGALADGVRTAPGLAVTLVAVVAALVVWWTDDARLAGLQVATTGLLAAAAVAGDAVRWVGESRRGSAVVLVARAVPAALAVVAGGVLAVRRPTRPEAGPPPDA